MKRSIFPVLLAVLLVIAFAAFPVSAAENEQVAKGRQVATDAANITFPTDATEYTAICPVCEVSATWLPLTPDVLGVGFTAAEANTHYYLTDSVEASGAKFTMVNSSSYTSCLHLNGKSLTNTDGVAVEGAAGVLNIMGTGLVKGGGAADAYSSPATVLMGNIGTINLYGGTYEKYAAAAATNTVGIGWGGGTVAVYSGAAVKASTAGSAVYMDSTMGAANATLNIYGGTVDGSASTDAPAVNTKAVDDSNTKVMTINLYDGVIKGGTGSYGGSVPLQEHVIMNMYGGTVQGGTATTSGGNIYVATGAVFKMYDGIIQNGEAATHGGNVYVGTSALFDMYNGTIQDGQAGTSGGNVQIYTSATFNMYNGTITRGTANLSSTNYLTGGGNVFAYTSAKFNMYDGTISYGNANKGGNVGSTKKATVNITGGVIEWGSAKAEGGNLFSSADSDKAENRVNINLENVIIRNGKTTAGPGGNIGVNRINMTIGEGTQILAGKAQGSTGRGGNIRVYIGTIVMNGGEISGGSSVHESGTDEIWVQGTSSYASVLYMLGGVIEGAETRNSSVRVDSYGRLYLGGDATVADNNTGNAEIYGNGPVYICDGWSGSATIKFETPGTVGETMSTGSLKVVTLDADRNATDGGSFSGRLKDLDNGAMLISTGAANGAVTIGVMAVVDAAGNVTVTDDPLTAWATGEYAFIRLYKAFQIADPAQDLWVDLNGCDLTLSGSGTVNVFDSANDAYKAAACGRITVDGTVTVNTDVTAPNGNRYIATTDAGVTTMHRLNIGLIAVTLRTTAAGLYYKAAYECDDVLAAKVSAYGVVLSLVDMPGADFNSAREFTDKNRFTMGTEPFKSGMIATSGSVFGIMKDSREANVNAQYGELKIYANPYLLLEEETFLVGDNENPGKTVNSEGFNGDAYSLHDVLDLIDDTFFDYSADAQKQIDAFYQQWKQLGMADWEFINIGSQTDRFDNSALQFAEGSTVAQCPACKTPVTWTPFAQPQDSAVGIGTAANGAHYYLTEDITYTGSNAGFIANPTAKNNSACLHLNGHNLKATAHGAIYTPYAHAGILNVMGEGTVSGNRSGTGTTVYLSSKDAAGRINLYGGTYVNPESNGASLVALINGGSIHMYDGAWIQSSGGDNAVYMDLAGNANTTFAVHGGKVTGGEMTVAESASKNTRKFIIEGRSYVEALVIRNINVAVEISGAPVIDRVALKPNGMLTIGNLKKGAKIAVSTSKVFTKPFEKAAEYLKYFYAWKETDSISVTDAGELCYDINYEHYMTPYVRDVKAQARADGQIHYYFMAAKGMVMSPTNAGDIDKWGDSCLVVFPNGETMLIDSGYDIQAPVIIGSLKRMGVTNLDYLVITHPHGDHIGGAFSSSSTFLDEITVGHVYYQNYQIPNNSWVGVVESRCDARNIPYTFLKMGDVRTFGGVTMTVLWSKETLTAEELAADDATNNNSMVLRFDYGEHSSLFTSDIYTATETKLRELYPNGELDVDMMKVPHHGLALSSSSLKFLQAVTPEIAVATGSFDINDTINTRYTSTDPSKGVGATLLEDRYHGYIHISSGTDGVMTTETE